MTVSEFEINETGAFDKPPAYEKVVFTNHSNDATVSFTKTDTK